MGTELDTIYSYFLARVENEEWVNEEDIEIFKNDWRYILDMAIFYFNYPRVSLEIDENTETFKAKLTNNEIQVLSILMKREWVKRCVSSLDNIRMKYSERDWEGTSSANHLDKLIKYQTTLNQEVKEALFTYSRSINYKPEPFSHLAGKDDV